MGRGLLWSWSWHNFVLMKSKENSKLVACRKGIYCTDRKSILCQYCPVLSWNKAKSPNSHSSIDKQSEKSSIEKQSEMTSHGKYKHSTSSCLFLKGNFPQQVGCNLVLIWSILDPLTWFLTHFWAFRWILPVETSLSLGPIKTLSQ